MQSRALRTGALARALRAPLAIAGLVLATLTCAGSATAAPGTVHRPVPPLDPDAAETASLRWLQGRLPPGGALVDGAVVHTVRDGESWTSIAEAYLDLTRVYDVSELAKAIVTANSDFAKGGATPGKRIRIPDVLPTAPKSGAAGRIGLPKDGVLRGLYVRGSTAGGRGYPALLDRALSHGLNAIVLDVKDYDGPLTFPSKVPLAVDAGATEHAPMRSYARAVQFAHAKGIRVIARVSCFNDQLMAKKHPGMAIRGVSGHPYRNGWLDPRNEMAQAYVADLVHEAIAAGADEIQLDYVRFPVIGMKNIDFQVDKKNPNAKVEIITRFVERIHRQTRAAGVPLSLDVFGVIAFGNEVDMANLGQDPAELAKHSEFLSAMVYPSHYDDGFMGFDKPGEHPELVGMGVKHMLSEIETRGGEHAHAKVRPWLQAMRHNSANYGAQYIKDEIRTGNQAGAEGFLLWNPGQIYDVAWSALPRIETAAAPRLLRARHTTR